MVGWLAFIFCQLSCFFCLRRTKWITNVLNYEVWVCLCAFVSKEMGRMFHCLICAFTKIVWFIIFRRYFGVYRRKRCVKSVVFRGKLTVAAFYPLIYITFLFFLSSFFFTQVSVKDLIEKKRKKKCYYIE